MIKTTSQWSIECQELIVALVLELHGELIDELGDQLADNTGLYLDPAMSVGELSKLLECNYHWALAVDFDNPESHAYFWYVSEEKLEPRLGIRANEPGTELELPLDIARQAKALYSDLDKVEPPQSVAIFLASHPQHRHVVRRVQASKDHPYLEIRDNLVGVQCVPLDILRYKLSFFGASKCDPKSNLWTRITMYQGAPLFDEITDDNCDDWWLPVLETQP